MPRILALLLALAPGCTGSTGSEPEAPASKRWEPCKPLEVAPDETGFGGSVDDALWIDDETLLVVTYSLDWREGWRRQLFVGPPHELRELRIYEERVEEGRAEVEFSVSKGTIATLDIELGCMPCAITASIAERPPVLAWQTFPPTDDEIAAYQFQCRRAGRRRRD